MLQEELPGVGVETLLEDEVIEDDLADGHAGRRFVLALDDVLGREPLQNGIGHASGNLVPPRHTRQHYTPATRSVNLATAGSAPSGGKDLFDKRRDHRLVERPPDLPDEGLDSRGVGALRA